MEPINAWLVDELARLSRLSLPEEERRARARENFHRKKEGMTGTGHAFCVTG